MQVYSGRRSAMLLRASRAKAQDGDNKNKPRTIATKRNRGLITSKPALRQRIACANETKRVDGEVCIVIACHASMPSNGVFLAEGMFIGSKISMKSGPSCGAARDRAERYADCAGSSSAMSYRRHP